MRRLSFRRLSFPLSLCHGEPTLWVRLWTKIINSGVEESIAKTEATHQQRSKSLIFKLFQPNLRIPQPRGSFSTFRLSCAPDIQLLLTSLNANTCAGCFLSKTPNATVRDARIKQYLQVTLEYSARILHAIYALSALPLATSFLWGWTLYPSEVLFNVLLLVLQCKQPLVHAAF